MDHALLSRRSLFHAPDLRDSLRWSKRASLDHIRKRHRLCHSILGYITARRSVASAIMCEIKLGWACDKIRVGARLCHVNDVVCGNIDTFDRACDDAGANCAGRVFALVDIDANAVDFMLGSGI